MSPLVRSIVAVFVGVVATGAVIGILELPANFVHPPPRDFNMNDREQIRRHTENAPTSAILIVLSAYVVGPFVGAWLAARLARRAQFLHAGIVAALFFALSVMNLRFTPGHPTWFAFANLTLFVPVTLLAAWLARPKAVQPPREVVASK